MPEADVTGPALFRCRNDLTVRRSQVPVDGAVLMLLIVMGIALYAKTFQVPWLFDDTQNIVENPIVHDLSSAIANLFGVRGFAYFTFALNYRFGGLDVFGYHLANFTIHLAASWVVWLLAKRVFATGGQQEGQPGLVAGSVLLPAAVALMFLVHPIQTQAVNYIVQRMTSLAAFLSLLALFAFCRARESRSAGAPLASPSHAGWYGMAAVSMALACMTKQNAILIPIEIFLFDWLILNKGALPSPLVRRLAYIAPLLLLSLTFSYLHVGKDDVALKDAGMAEYWARAEEASAEKKLVPVRPATEKVDIAQPKRVEKPPENLQALYLATEMTVLWEYLRLLLLPYGQVFDYGYPLDAKAVTVQSVVAAAGHLVLVVLALSLARRKPLTSFGILWFYVCLSVESSIIPLDAMVEHRLYLPIFGFAVALVGMVRDLPRQRVALWLLCIVVAAYSIAGLKRNLLWSDPIAFARDGRAKAPHNQRNHLTLATAYADARRWPEAEVTLRRAIPIRPYHHVPYDNLGVALVQQGKFSEARSWFSLASRLEPGYPNAVYNYGYASFRLGDTPAVIRSMQRLKELGSPLAMQLGAQFFTTR